MSGRPAPDLDRDLAHLPPEGRWREWMLRIEAVLFAYATPVPRADLARVVGPGASVDLLLDDLAADLAERPYEVVRIGGGWMLRTRPAYGPAIRAAADLPEAGGELTEGDLVVLVTIAYHQPITRDGLKEIFGREISRDLIGRLSARGLVAPGRRYPRRGAPYTYVPTDAFLARFGLATLDDLPDPEQVEDAGLEPPTDRSDGAS
ncbi:segregation and condensation protein B [Palleronia aestuarii]|uniref:Segregation and condensation protein B n=1 Tax=Palleronia aestuarii TaxID=568105 RepID=A0A2W7MQE5_9RHOB|nr:SMC-Scp complex subunit ScpB [Palleronia aestuarii]PZX09793.1 segregation and condensation protein B [Palleronia aestuarii]